jgi:hypothetical protein
VRASCEQDAAIVQQRGHVPNSFRGHLADIDERAGEGIIEFGTGETRGCLSRATGDQDRCIREQE